MAVGIWMRRGWLMTSLPQTAIAVIVEGDWFIAAAVGWGLDFLGSLTLDVMVFFILATAY